MKIAKTNIAEKYGKKNHNVKMKKVEKVDKNCFPLMIDVEAFTDHSILTFDLIDRIGNVLTKDKPNIYDKYFNVQSISELGDFDDLEDFVNTIFRLVENELISDIEGIDILIGNKDKSKIVSLLD